MRILKFFFVAMGAFFSLHASSEEVVNVYNWSDYIDEDIIDEFEEETGIKVVYDVFDSNDILETKLLAGSSGYDVVVPSGSFLERQIQAGVFRKLDKSKLSNFDNLWDVILERTAKFDPNNEYSINYMWGTTGLGYNEEKIRALIDNPPLDSWALLFDEQYSSKLAECGIYVLDAADELIPTLLNYMGEDPLTQDTDVIKKTEEPLKAIRPFITKFHSSEYINALANGDICLAVGWSGDILQARDRADEADNGVSVSYVAPKEGAVMWFDQMAIPKDAKNQDNAHTFINYILRPEVMAKASNYVYYANGNLASQQYLEEDVIGDNAIFPDAKTMQNLFVVRAYTPRTQRVVNRVWTNVKSNR